MPANPQSFNRYSYCLNNPLKYTDPSGHVVTINGMDVNAIDYLLMNPEMYAMAAGSEEFIETITSEEYQTYSEFRVEYVEVAKILEESDTVFKASMNTGLLQIESQKSHNYVYIENGKIKETDKYTFSANREDFVTHTYKAIESIAIISIGSVIEIIGLQLTVSGAILSYSGIATLPGLAMDAIGVFFDLWGANIILREVQGKAFPNPFKSSDWFWNWITQ